MHDIIDCHVHICPDNLAEKNTEIIKKFSGITPAYNGSVAQLHSMMQKCGITKSIVNNTVLKPELMSKANDFTNQVAAKHGNLLPMAWIVPGNTLSIQEVQRCKDLGFKGVKIHNSHFKVLPADASNDKIYEKIVECELPVLFHCGYNPYSASGQTQYAEPKNFIQTIKSYPEMKIILAHLAGYQDDPKGAIDALGTSKNVFADLAFDPEKKNLELEGVIAQIGAENLLFGSDYPIHDGTEILDKLGNLERAQFEAICSLNPKKVFSTF